MTRTRDERTSKLELVIGLYPPLILAPPSNAGRSLVAPLALEIHPSSISIHVGTIAQTNTSAGFNIA